MTPATIPNIPTINKIDLATSKAVSFTLIALVPEIRSFSSSVYGHMINSFYKIV